MSSISIGEWEPAEEREKRLKEQKAKAEQQREEEERKRKERENRRNELLTSEDPAYDEEGYIKIMYYSPDMSGFDSPYISPDSLELKCKKRYALLLQEGLIEAKEMPGFREALNEEGLDLDQDGNIVESKESLERARREWEDEIAYYQQLNEKKKEEEKVKPEDIARETTNLPEERINSAGSWLKNTISKMIGKGR